MDNNKPYLDYKFMGIKSFIASLNEAKAQYRLFDQDDFTALYKNNPEILTAEDTIQNGFVIRNESGLYFTEFGLKITKSYHSYVVFLFNYHPRIEDLQAVLQDINGLVEKYLNNVDIDAMSQTINSTRNNQN